MAKLKVKSLMNVLIADMEVLMTRRTAMTIDNVIRLEHGQALAWSAEDFFELATDIDEIARRLHKMAEV